MFERLKAALTGRSGRGTGPWTVLREALLPISAIDPQLYQRCVDYVADGTGPETLTALAAGATADLSALMASAGKWRKQPHLDDRRQALLEELGFAGLGAVDQVANKRLQFYAGPTGAGEPEQLIRFAQVITIAGGGPNRQVDDAPDWFQALVNDLVLSTGVTGSYRQEPELGNVLATSRWTPQFLAELLALDASSHGNEPAPDYPRIVETVTAVLFQDEADPWSAPPHPSLLPGVDDWLRRHGPQLSVEIGRRLTASGRIRLLARAEQDRTVATALAAIVAGWSVDPAKSVRLAALPVLGTFPPEQRAHLVTPVLTKAAAAHVGELAELLAQDPATDRVIIQAAEENPKIAALVEKVSARQAALDAAGEQPELELPPYDPLPDTADRESIRADLLSFLHAQPAARAAKITKADIEDFLDVATGVHDHDSDGSRDLAPNIAHQLHVGFLATRMPSLGALGRIRILMKLTPGYGWWPTDTIDPETDLRAVADVVHRLGGEDDRVARLYTVDMVDPEAAWPWFAEHPDVLAAWLKDGPMEAGYAFRLLEIFPAVPASLVPVLASLAFGTTRTARTAAQNLLAQHPAARGLAENGLTDSSGEIRAGAARWLAVIGDPEAIGALQTALGKEKREVPRAAMLAAVEALGGDVSSYLSPELLLKDARKGLRAKLPASLDWFDFEQLPSAHWADGTPVEPQIIRWWVVLADKLKDPDGSGLLDRYLGLLADSDAAELGRFALRIWIAQDTRHPTEDESRQHATAVGTVAHQNAQNRLQRARADQSKFLHTYERSAAIPLEQRVAEAFEAHQATYRGSASADKGLLALTTRMPGIDLAQAVEGYIRDHGARRAQVDMLVHALYGNGSPAALQVLLRIARRFRQATVQATAMRLVEQLADDRGWSSDELADRTVPSAGFGDDRLLHLDFGPREFIGRISATGTIALTSPGGKSIKSLPKPRADDDQEAAAAARKQLTASRKELKSVLSVQTARLYEAMCVQRTWSAADWRDYLLDHPVLSGVVSSLVWLEFPAAADRAAGSFRPAEDGALIDCADEPVHLDDTSRIGLAHRVLLSEDDVTAWQQHLEDYEVRPAFDQLTNRIPDLDPAATAVTDLRGHVTDTFSFRGVATKRGYQRGAVEDAAWFLDYRKTFSSAGLVTVIDFTGSFLPEENIACATEKLSFVRRRRSVPLSDVPPVLLAEGYADWAALAALGPYDPDYRETTRF